MKNLPDIKRFFILGDFGEGAGAHTKTDLKVHLIWISKYRKRVLTGPVAIRARDLLRQIALEHEIEIISGKVCSDHIHMFIPYHPTQNISKVVQWLKGISSRMLLSEFPHLKKQFWGRHVWARGCLAVRSSNITDEMIQQYIEEQGGSLLSMTVDFKSTPPEIHRLIPIVDTGRG